MALFSPLRSLVFAGVGEQSGSYVLRLHISRPIHVSLGSFRGGQPLTFSPGPYLYVGSALAAQGSTSLPRRLLRHATRRTGPPHPLQASLQRHFPTLAPPAVKRLHWHIDYLLEQPAVALTCALLLGSRKPLEAALAAWLAPAPGTGAPVPGAGASDAPGETHLFSFTPYAGWWVDLCRGVTLRFAEAF